MRIKKASPGKSRVVGEVLVDGLSHDGRGLSRSQGKTLFIEGALPGEQVSVKITEDRRRFLSGKTIAVEHASEQRVKPPCQHFKTCGGCSLQYWSHEGQLQGKQDIVLDQLQRFSSLTPETVLPPLSSEPYGYRYRCRLSMRWKSGRLSLGFREQQSKQIVNISHCPVLAEPLQALPAQLQELLPTLKQKEAISHAELLLAEGGRGLLLRHIKPLSTSDLEILKVFALEQQLHLYLQDSPAHITCHYAPDEDHWLYYQIPELDLKFQFRPQDFTQVNWPINRKMVLQALAWLELKSTDRVLDLFCGLGNFSLALAREAGHVVGVEGSAASVERATFNAGINQFENTEFYQADLSALMEDRKAGVEWLNQEYDALLLDPPRTGAKEIIEQMTDMLPDRVLYISCNPATLARDAGILAEQGFKLARLGVMDMFPQTAHVESMALFTRS